MDSHPAARRARQWAPFAALVIVYVLSRAAVYLAGVRFDLSPLATSWQILDPVLLRHDLLTSLLYMPGQPPLYNLMLGIVLKISPDKWATAALFRGLYDLMSLASVLLMYALLRRLAVSRAAAFVVTALFMLSPALMLYESLPYYTLPVLVLLGLIAWLFHACMTAFTPPRAIALFMTMAVLIWTRSMFQVEWFVVLVAFGALVLPGHRRAVLVAAIVPLLLIVSLYAKNAVLTGDFSTSDWMGMSLAKLTTLEIPHDERRRMVDAGKLSPLALDDRAYDIPKGYKNHISGNPHTGIAVLDHVRKSTGHVNFNYLPYREISKHALHDALASIRTHPGIYVHSVGIAWLMFWRPSSDYPFLHDNRAAIGGWSRAYGKVVAGQPVYPPKPGFDLNPGNIGIFIAIGYVAAVLFGLFVLIRCALRRRVSAADATLIFLWLNVMYVSVVGNLLEIDENQRFRFAVNPFIAILLIVGIRRALARWRHKEPQRPSYGPEPLGNT